MSTENAEKWVLEEKKEVVTRAQVNCIMRSFINCEVYNSSKPITVAARSKA
jgi:hypothetical protein